MSSLSRTYSSKSRSHLSISPGHDKEEISNRLDSLLDDSGGRWTLTSDGKGLERAFHFKTFNSTWVGYSPFSNKAHDRVTHIYRTS